MNEPWEKPLFDEISVNGECTAYVGALRGPDLSLSAVGDPGTMLRPEQGDAAEKQT